MTGIQTIGVIGGGTMGTGIAQVAARSGFNVVLHDLEQRFLERALQTITKNLDREVAKGTINAEDKTAALSRIVPASKNSVLTEADFVIEAVIEEVATKSKVFEAVDAIARPGVILASNTSSISITKIASKTKRPDRVIGMHFMNPVPIMTLVEIVRGLATSDETCQTTNRLAESLGKTPVEVNDFPGFVSNRVLMPMINEAVYCVMEGVGTKGRDLRIVLTIVGTKEAIDSVMKLGMNHPIGPLALADLIGLDVCLDIMEVLHTGLGEAKYRPCPLLRKMVDAGRLGRKSGQGFYRY